jgi:hypothetical protein
MGVPHEELFSALSFLRFNLAFNLPYYMAKVSLHRLGQHARLESFGRKRLMAWPGDAAGGDPASGFPDAVLTRPCLHWQLGYLL